MSQPQTVGALPWYQSPVMIAQVVTAITAFTAIAPQVAVKFGLTDQSAITNTVSSLFGVIAFIATLYGAFKRKTSTVQPLTMTQAAADVHPATAVAKANPLPTQKGHARLGLLLVLAAIAGCAALGLQPATNTPGTIGYAYGMEASLLATGAQLASTGAISQSIAIKANTALMAVKLSLDNAAAAATSSAPIPVTVINTATATLATIAAYLTCEQQKGTTCQL
jgi:hypothetical protein